MFAGVASRVCSNTDCAVCNVFVAVTVEHVPLGLVETMYDPVSCLTNVCPVFRVVVPAV